MCKIVFNSIFRQSIKNTLKCLSTALILIILHRTHGCFEMICKMPSRSFINQNTSFTKFKRWCFWLWVTAACLRVPSSVLKVYCKLHFMDFTAILGRTKGASQKNVKIQSFYLHKLSFLLRFGRLCWCAEAWGEEANLKVEWRFVFLPRILMEMNFNLSKHGAITLIHFLLSYRWKEHNLKSTILPETFIYGIFSKSTICLITSNYLALRINYKAHDCNLNGSGGWSMRITNSKRASATQQGSSNSAETLSLNKI